MLIGLIADVHGNVGALRAVLDEIAAAGAGMVLCAGDLVGYHPHVNETIALIRSRGVECILGNHDAMLTGQLAASDDLLHRCALDTARRVIEPEHLEWLRALPVSRQLDLNGTRVHVFHGSPWNPLTEYIYPDFADFPRFAGVDASYVILGHTHRPLLRHAGRVTVINPGSCGQPRDGVPTPAYALLDAEVGAVEFRRSAPDAPGDGKEQP